VNPDRFGGPMIIIGFRTLNIISASVENVILAFPIYMYRFLAASGCWFF